MRSFFFPVRLPALGLFVCLFSVYLILLDQLRCRFCSCYGGINYFSPAFVAACKFNSNSSFLRGELVKEGCLGSLLLVSTPRGWSVSVPSRVGKFRLEGSRFCSTFQFLSSLCVCLSFGVIFRNFRMLPWHPCC